MVITAFEFVPAQKNCFVPPMILVLRIANLGLPHGRYDLVAHFRIAVYAASRSKARVAENHE